MGNSCLVAAAPGAMLFMLGEFFWTALPSRHFSSLRSRELALR